MSGYFVKNSKETKTYMDLIKPFFVFFVNIENHIQFEHLYNNMTQPNNQKTTVEKLKLHVHKKQCFMKNNSFIFDHVLKCVCSGKPNKPALCILTSTIAFQFPHFKLQRKLVKKYQFQITAISFSTSFLDFIFQIVNFRSMFPSFKDKTSDTLNIEFLITHTHWGVL